jgi:hypothetical protein
MTPQHQILEEEADNNNSEEESAVFIKRESNYTKPGPIINRPIPITITRGDSLTPEQKILYRTVARLPFKK